MSDLRSQLDQFTGSEHWHRHGLVRSVVLTDGAKYFADHAGGGAYWLMDILATELPALVKQHHMIFVDVTVKDGKADLVAKEDARKKPIWQRHIDITDLPDGDWQLWMGTGGPQNTIVILLPSEY